MRGAVAAHLEWLRLRGLRPATIATRAGRLRHLAAATRTDCLLELDRAALDEWQAHLHLTPGARSAYVSHVQQFYAWALRDGWIDVDPSVHLIHPKVPRRVPRPISEDDLYAAVATASARVRPWLVLAGWAGLRAGEIARLERADVRDADTPPMLLVADGKGGRQRVIPLSSRVLAELAGMPRRGYVFPRHDGRPGPNAPWMVSHLANRHLHGLGIPATLHQIRHRFGTRLYAECCDLRLTQELMGHSSPATTAGYVAYSHRRAVAAVEAMARAS